MKLMRCVILTLAICAIVLSAAYANIATVDFLSKSAKSDNPAIDAKWVRTKGQQLGLYVQSTVEEPQTFTLRFTGLSDQTYDVYINGYFVYTKAAKELDQGINLSIPGAITDLDMMLCLNSLKDKVKAENDKLQKSENPEAKRVAGTLAQAVGWITSGLMADETYRSVEVRIAPAGQILEHMVWRMRTDAEGVASTVTNACWLLQKARYGMNRVIEDPEIRNSAVATLTPVDFTANYSIKSGKAHVTAKLVNNCNLTISGNITMGLPKGWKSTAKNLTFDNLKTGKIFVLSFDLVPSIKDAIVPEKLPIAANIYIAQSQFGVKYKLKVIAASCCNAVNCK